ncbi:nitrite reductase (NAD(P)H) small subunit [Dietzia aurantiaca]|uniref:nitrite reductase (NAD(P)H) small subunit n=1 Tax=Dietzia aurantiaca TaxID=983873 RepID=UPI001E5867D3|nr:nitrite reductase (NAD(P)H) small subunit [Dietzia aurantiaca]MCD2263017.1 nitrite reductase (NAD(P)H) small subunit [Dietzia aurantiaca]
MTTSLRRTTAAFADPADPADRADHGTIEIPVCPVDRLIRGRGVAALLPDGRQVAVYLVDDEIHALCNIDPVARAAVMSRGLVGDRAGVPAVISPIGKQAYALADGRGLDDPSRGISVFPARVASDGTVVIATEAAVRYSIAA